MLNQPGMIHIADSKFDPFVVNYFGLMYDIPGDGYLTTAYDGSVLWHMESQEPLLNRDSDGYFWDESSNQGIPIAFVDLNNIRPECTKKLFRREYDCVPPDGGHFEVDIKAGSRIRLHKDYQEYPGEKYSDKP